MEPTHRADEARAPAPPTSRAIVAVSLAGCLDRLRILTADNGDDTLLCPHVSAPSTARGEFSTCFV